MRNMIFWFCVPWVAFIGIATIVTGIHKPGVIPMLVLLVVLLGFATRAEYRKAQAKADALLAEAKKLTQERMAEDAAQRAADGATAATTPRPSGEFTSFAFRHGLPPGALKRKPPPPLALPPPADDS